MDHHYDGEKHNRTCANDFSVKKCNIIPGFSVVNKSMSEKIGLTTTIKSAKGCDQEQAVAVIMLAFATDPMARWIYPDPHQYLRHFPDVIRLFAGNAFEHGTGYMVDDFSGAALWLPPNVHPREPETTKLLQQTVPKENQKDVFAVLEAMGSHHPSEPHWYLPMIGVDPMQQGKGYGSVLIQHSLVACDRENKRAYLETSNPRNVPLYERYGFELLETIQVGPSPPVFLMLRQPRAVIE